MVLKEHQHLDVSWETTPPIQGLEDDSLHPDLVLAIERWCTGLPVNVEPWLPKGEDFTSRVRRACAQIPWGKPEPTVSWPSRPVPPKPVARWDKPCGETRCLCSSPATVLWGASGLGGYAGEDQNGPQLARKRAILAFEQDVRQSEVGSI